MGKTSTYHPAVTLFELPPASSALQPSLPGDAEADGSPRRSKRIKLERDTEAAGSAGAGADESASFLNTTESRDAQQKTIHGIPTTSRQHTELPMQDSPVKGLRDANSPRKRVRATTATQKLSGVAAAPARWREAYDKIKEMRTNVTAPVDTMGAGAAQLGESVPKVRRASSCTDECLLSLSASRHTGRTNALLR